jgi:hypothetical protein
VKAVGFLPGHDFKLELRRVLLHSTESGHEIVALCVGERAWPGAEQMVESGDADVVVTTGRSGHTTAPYVEIAGSGRLTLRTYARATRLRQIADLVDSGLSDEMVLRILRDAR